MIESMISVIIPVYNAEKYLYKCLESITNQTYSNLEIICVNDGSQDSSRTILQEFKEKDNRITIIDKQNGGLSDARNTGLTHVHGEYVMFVDSDDWLDITACEKSIKAAEEHQVDVVMWPYIREYSHASLKKNIFDHDIYFDQKQTYEHVYRRFFGLYGEELGHPENADALVTVWGKLYRSELILKHDIRFVDTKEIATCEDALFNIQVFQYVRSSYFMDCPLYHYRKNTGSFTAGYNPALLRQWFCLYKKMKDVIRENNLDSRFQESLYNRIALNVIGLGFNALSSDKNFREKRKEIQGFLSDPIVKGTVKKLDVKYLPMHWKIFFFCSKKQMVLPVYFLILIMNKLRSR